MVKRIVLKKLGFIVSAPALLVILMVSPNAFAATSPALNNLSGYSVLAGAGLTCTGATTTTGTVGVTSGTSITGFPTPCTSGGGIESNTASAIAAQAESLTTFGTLDQTCDQSYGAQDLTLLSPLGPGVYCSTSSFTLSGNLNLTGSGVWIFKTVTSLITSPGSSVTGGDPCNVWWRIGSATTLNTTTSFIGNVISQNGLSAMDTGATLNGRFLALTAGTITLDSNTISGPICTVAAASTVATRIIPGLPNTGLAPEKHNTDWWSLGAGLALVSFSLYSLRKNLNRN